jgi:hypothetical protein
MSNKKKKNRKMKVERKIFPFSVKAEEMRLAMGCQRVFKLKKIYDNANPLGEMD